jgi:hypothetical protein
VPKPSQARVEDLPPDNGARLAIFDVIAAAVGDDPTESEGLTTDELRGRVIGRLRVLVPQELHVTGEQEYVNSKVSVCLEAGLLKSIPSQPERLALGYVLPQVRYPDGTVRDYTPGLESARERLESDDQKLRQAGFNIRHIVKPSSIRRKSDSYRRLVASMKEHGFLDQFRLTESATAGVIDGLARQAAAAEAGVVLKKQHYHRLPRRRDTPLHHTLLVLDANADRLTEEELSNVHEVIAQRIGRPWIEVEDDLAVTRDWRRAEPKGYDAVLEVELLPFTGQEEAKVQVTTDHTRVMLRSLMREAGLPEYDRDLLKPFVPTEEARTKLSGRKAIFVGVDDAIAGIGKMQRQRTRERLKVDKAWEDVRLWLIDEFGPSDSRPFGPSDAAGGKSNPKP